MLSNPAFPVTEQPESGVEVGAGDVLVGVPAPGVSEGSGVEDGGSLVAPLVGLEVRVGVRVGVLVLVGVVVGGRNVGVLVLVGVLVTVGVREEVAEGVCVSVAVDVDVEVCVGVPVSADVGVEDGIVIPVGAEVTTGSKVGVIGSISGPEAEVGP